MPVISPLSLTDIIDAALLLTAVVGIFLTLAQVQASRKTQKATFFRDMHLGLINDPDIAEVMDTVSRGDFHYEAATFYGSPMEKQLDKTLHHLEVACELFYQRLITEREMKFVNYVMIAVVMDPEVQKYLMSLEQGMDSAAYNVAIYGALSRYARTHFPAEALTALAQQIQASKGSREHDASPS
jgi:hypothetical protein